MKKREHGRRYAGAAIVKWLRGDVSMLHSHATGREASTACTVKGDSNIYHQRTGYLIQMLIISPSNFTTCVSSCRSGDFIHHVTLFVVIADTDSAEMFLGAVN